MKFKIRLAYYMFGLFLGIIGVYYFLTAKAENRGVEFCYFPNCRVLKELRNKPIEYSTETQAFFKENNLTENNLKQILTHGDVDFSKSNVPFENGKLYIIEGQIPTNEEVSLQFIIYSSKVKFKGIEKIKKN